MLPLEYPEIIANFVLSFATPNTDMLYMKLTHPDKEKKKLVEEAAYKYYNLTPDSHKPKKSGYLVYVILTIVTGIAIFLAAARW